jgi:hypothetical protein
MVSGKSKSIGDTLVVAAFRTHSDAQQAVRDLRSEGFVDEQIGLAAQDREGLYSEGGTRQDSLDNNQAGEGAAIGATAGLGAGALWGLGIVAGVLPAIGPVIAGGALAAIVASAASTAAAGGVIGALIGLGVPEEEAEYYQRELEQGRTIVTVRASGLDAENARRILDRSNAYDFHRPSADY